MTAPQVQRPIIFSAPMVRAILKGRKTQTRRVVKPLPSWQVHSVCAPALAAQPWDVWFHFPETERVGHMRTCPYGVPGDRLWVRETFCGAYSDDGGNSFECRDLNGMQEVVFRADGVYPFPVRRWRPAIFMPRWASRITLEITDVRVQRVQEIGLEDCLAEGIDVPGRERMLKIGPINRACDEAHSQAHFWQLWDSINAKRGFGWDTNPWVWAITFRSRP